MAHKLEIAGVTPQRMDRLRAFLARDGLHLTGDAGTLRGDFIDVDYEYDPAGSVLTVQPTQLPPHLEDDKGAEPLSALRGMLDIALDTDPSLPSHCGVYTYALVTIDNQSGLELTYSTSDMSLGNLYVKAQQIQTGVSTLAFENESAKSKMDGVAGMVVYTLADGVTMLNISWRMASAADASFNAGLEGANAARYTVANAHTGGYMDGYTYLTPTTTISKAT